MRLLKVGPNCELILTPNLEENLPAYAILSHTWSLDSDEEVTFKDLKNGKGNGKPGYRKLLFCAEQAQKDKIEYIWVDTCCIKKSDDVELSEALRSMFRWYQNAEKCYVYMSDVSSSLQATHQTPSVWNEFPKSRWFTRGWTLQELLAPRSVEFFSQEGCYLGSKTTLERQIHAITQISVTILQGESLSSVSPAARFEWMRHRKTKKAEDRAYCLLGIFQVSMPILYGEGVEKAFERLREEVGITINEINDTIRNAYTEERLHIQRLSGELLPLCDCYINLCIVDHRRDSDAQQDASPSPFSLASRLRLDNPPRSQQLSLERIFDIRERNNGEQFTPSRILVWGRAGMGKTTLCKKIVSDFYSKGLWRDKYDHLVWLPLRHLKLPEYQACNSIELIIKVFGFTGREKNLVAQIKSTLTQSERTLFLLDGLDEVSDLSGLDRPNGSVLKELLSRRHVIITSRPHSTSILDHEAPDTELDTLGFFPEQVEEYIRRTEETTRSHGQLLTIQQFLSGRPLLKTLARIPIQLDAICYAWNQDHFPKDNVTMTALYSFICSKLWGEYTIRHGTKFKGKELTRQHIQNLDVTSLTTGNPVQDEQSFVQELAFQGLCSERLDFGVVDLEPLQQAYGILNSDPVDMPFLRSSDNSLKISARTLHFIHLTYQEFFAAQYFVRYWICDEPLKMNSNSFCTSQMVHPAEFVATEKYTDRYDIFWRFVTGLLCMSTESGHLDQFLDLIHEQSVDLVGLAHQRLIIHCLREIDPGNNHFKARIQNLEERYIEWLFCQQRFSASNSLMAEYECSDFILKKLLEDDRTCGTTMNILRSRTTISPEIMKTILRTLDQSTDKKVRQAAIVILGMHSDRSQKELQQFWHSLQDTSATRRKELISALAEEKNLQSLAVGALIGLLQDSDRGVRSQAVSALRAQRSLPEVAITSLVALLQHLYSGVRQRAAAALKGQQSLPEVAITSLVTLLQDSNPAVRAQATSTLGVQISLSEVAVTGLVTLLQDSNSDVRSQAVYALKHQGSLSEVATTSLVTLLQHSDLDIRRLSISALSGKPGLLEVALNSLITLLQDPDLDVCWLAVYSLRVQKSLPEAVITNLITLFQHSDTNVRRRAVFTLQCQQSLPEVAVTSLIALLQEPDLHVRQQAKSILEDQICLPEVAITYLITLLQHPNLDVRRQATSTLKAQISLSEVAVTSLVALLQHLDSDVRRQAISALKGQQSLPEVAITSLVTLLQDPDPAVRQQAASTLGVQISLLEVAVTGLVTLLQDSNSDVRWQAVCALKHQGSLPEVAVQDLVTLLQDSFWIVRRWAASTLRVQKSLSEAVVTDLIALLQHSNADVRRRAASVLNGQTSLPEVAVIGLVALLWASESDVRWKALSVLEAQKRLPRTAIDALLKSLQNVDPDVGRLIVRNLSGREEFFPFISGLDIPTIQSLLKAWLWTDFVVYFSGGHLHFQGSGTLWKVPLGLQKWSDLCQLLVRARVELGLPDVSFKTSEPKRQANPIQADQVKRRRMDTDPQALL